MTNFMAADFHLDARRGADHPGGTCNCRDLLGRRPDGIVLTTVDAPSQTDRSRCCATRGSRLVETWDSGRPFLDLGVGFDAFAAASSMTQFPHR